MMIETFKKAIKKPVFWVGAVLVILGVIYGQLVYYGPLADLEWLPLSLILSLVGFFLMVYTYKKIYMEG